MECRSMKTPTQSWLPVEALISDGSSGTRTIRFPEPVTEHGIWLGGRQSFRGSGGMTYVIRGQVGLLCRV